MKIRNKETGEVHIVLEGTLYAKNIFEEVKDEEIKVGEPKIEYEIEEAKEEPEKVEEKPVKAKKSTKKTKKGAKKNDTGNSKH